MQEIICVTGVIEEKRNIVYVTLNGQPIEHVSTAKFLGVCLTNKLSWNIHVDTICKKARKIIGFIHRSFHSSPVNIRLTLYPLY